MKVEYSENGRKPVKKKRKKHSKLSRIITAVTVIAVVLGVTVSLMLTVFFNVTAVKVVGSSIYSVDEVIYASGIMTGDNLLRLPSEKIEQRIAEALPYVKKATVIKSYPDTVGIELTPAEESVMLVTKEGSFIADSDFKILRTADEHTDGLIKVVGIDASDVAPGKTLVFNEKQQRDVLKDLCAICSENGFSVDYINIESLLDINFVIDGRLFIRLGSYNNMSGKLTHLKTMTEVMDSSLSASISLVDWSVENKKAVLKYEDISELLK